MRVMQVMGRYQAGLCAGPHRLGGGDVGARRGDVGLRGVHKADAVLQQVQHGVAQDEAVQLKGLRGVERLLYVGRHREGLVRAAAQRLHHLPHLRACAAGMRQHYVITTLNSHGRNRAQANLEL